MNPDQWTVETLALGIRAKRQGIRIETDRKGKYRAVTVRHTRWMTYDEMDRWLTILWESDE